MTVVSIRRRIRMSRAQRRALEQRISLLAQRVESATEGATITSSRIERAASELVKDRARIARAGF